MEADQKRETPEGNDGGCGPHPAQDGLGSPLAETGVNVWEKMAASCWQTPSNLPVTGPWWGLCKIQLVPGLCFLFIYLFN